MPSILLDLLRYDEKIPQGTRLRIGKVNEN